MCLVGQYLYSMSYKHLEKYVFLSDDEFIINICNSTKHKSLTENMEFQYFDKKHTFQRLQKYIFEINIK